MAIQPFSDFAASLAASNQLRSGDIGTATAGIGTNAEQGNNYTVDLGNKTTIGKTSTGGFSGNVASGQSLAGQNEQNNNVATQPPPVDQSYYEALANKAHEKAGKLSLGAGYGGNAMAGAKEGLAGSGSTDQQNAFAGTGTSDGQRIAEEEYETIMDNAAEAAAEKAKEKATESTDYISGGMGDNSGFQDNNFNYTDEISEYGGLGNDLYQPKTMDEIAQEYASYQSGMRDNYFRGDTLDELNKWQNMDAQQYAEDISAREAEILDATYKRMMGNQMRNMQAGMGARGMGMGGAASAMAGDIAASAALDRANAGIGIRQGARGEALGMKQGAMSMFGQEAGDIFNGFRDQQRLDIERQAADNLNQLIDAQLAAAFGTEPSGGGGGAEGTNSAADAQLYEGPVPPSWERQQPVGDEYNGQKAPNGKQYYWYTDPSGKWYVALGDKPSGWGG